MTDALFLDPERIIIQQWLPLVSLVFMVQTEIGQCSPICILPSWLLFTLGLF